MQFAIQPFSHSAIQPFSHSAIQPFSHSAIIYHFAGLYCALQ